MNRTKAILATIALALAIGSVMTRARTGVPRQSGVAHSTAGLTYHIDNVYPSATAVIPRMYGSAQPDTIPGRYRYTYTLANEPSSANTIAAFALDPVPKPLSVTPPLHWLWMYGFETEDSALYFEPDGGTTAPVGWDSLTVPRSIYDLAPGDSLTFGFVSDRAPSMTTFFVQGYYQDSISTEFDARLEAPSIWNNSVSGAVIGPGAMPATHKSK